MTKSLCFGPGIMEMDHIYTQAFLYIDSYLFAVMLRTCSKVQVQPMEGFHQTCSKEPVCPWTAQGQEFSFQHRSSLPGSVDLHRNRNMTLSGAGKGNGADSGSTSYKHHRALGTTNLDQSIARLAPPLQFLDHVCIGSHLQMPLIP